MSDPFEDYLRAVGEVAKASIRMVKRFILFIVVVGLTTAAFWIVFYFALGGFPWA